MGRRAASTENLNDCAAMTAVSDDKTPGLGFLLREAYRAFSRELTVQLEQYGITYAQWVFLWFLYQRGHLLPMDFAKLANIKKSSVTGVLNAIQSQGLVSSRRGESDARQVVVRLTSHGQLTVKKLFRCAVEANLKMTATLSEEEVEELMRLLGKVVSGLNEARTPSNSIVILNNKKPKQSD